MTKREQVIEWLRDIHNNVNMMYNHCRHGVSLSRPCPACEAMAITADNVKAELNALRTALEVAVRECEASRNRRRDMNDPKRVPWSSVMTAVNTTDANPLCAETLRRVRGETK